MKNNAFNKIRFCFFPKFYEFNRKEPLTYPFERGKEAVNPDLFLLSLKRNRHRVIAKRIPVAFAPAADFTV